MYYFHCFFLRECLYIVCLITLFHIFVPIALRIDSLCSKYCKSRCTDAYPWGKYHFRNEMVLIHIFIHIDFFELNPKSVHQNDYVYEVSASNVAKPRIFCNGDYGEKIARKEYLYPSATLSCFYAMNIRCGNARNNFV